MYKVFLVSIAVVLISAIIPFRLLGYIDELLLLISVFFLLPLSYFKFDRFGKIFVVSVFLFYISAIVNFLISPYSDSFVLMSVQSFVFFKGYVLTFVLIQLFRNRIVKFDKAEKDRVMLERIIGLLFILLIVTSIINFIFPDFWLDFINVERVRYREGRLRLNAFFQSGGSFAYFLSFYITLSWFIKRKSKVEWHPYRELFALLVVIATATIFFTYRKIIAIAAFALFFFFFQLRPIRRLQIIGIMVLIFPVLYAGIVGLSDSNLYHMTIDDLSKFDNPDHYYIRGRMFYHGFELLLRFFPFGSSLGTFGSVTSLVNGNGELYAEFGLMHWYERGQGIYDSMIGSIAGESGFVGLLLFFIATITFYKSIVNELSPYYKFLFRVVFSFVVFSFFLGPLIQDGIGAAMLTLFIGYIYVNGVNIKTVVRD